MKEKILRLGVIRVMFTLVKLKLRYTKDENKKIQYVNESNFVKKETMLKNSKYISDI